MKDDWEGEGKGSASSLGQPSSFARGRMNAYDSAGRYALIPCVMKAAVYFAPIVAYMKKSLQPGRRNHDYQPTTS
jgi:hypothetical protein